MSFAEETGRTRSVECFVCGQTVTHKEVRRFTMPEDRFSWSALPHRAPCGAHCAGGSYAHGETDVHVPAFGTCARCGTAETEVATRIENAEGSERVVIHRYTPEYRRSLGFRIDLELLVDGVWRVKSRWPTNHPDSLEQTVQWAKHYVLWLNDVA
jgi:hypothetical protein